MSSCCLPAPTALESRAPVLAAQLHYPMEITRPPRPPRSVSRPMRMSSPRPDSPRPDSPKQVRSTSAGGIKAVCPVHGRNNSALLDFDVVPETRVAPTYSPLPHTVSIHNFVEVSEAPVEAMVRATPTPPSEPTPAWDRSESTPALMPTASLAPPPHAPTETEQEPIRPPPSSTPAAPEVVSRPATAPPQSARPPPVRRSSAGVGSFKSGRRLSEILAQGLGFGRGGRGDAGEEAHMRRTGPRRPSTSEGIGMRPPPFLSSGSPPYIVQPPSPQPLRSSTPSPTRRSSASNPVLPPRAPALGQTWRSTLSSETFERCSLEYGAIEMRRQEVIFELCETERAFVAGLRAVVELLASPLRQEDGTWLSLVPSTLSRLLSFLDDIVDMHAEMSAALDSARAAQVPVVLRIADVLAPFVERMAVHLPYLVSFETASTLIEDLVAGRLPRPSAAAQGPKALQQSQDLGRLAEFLRMQSRRAECGKLGLSSFLLKPVQRLMKYPLFVRQLCELSPPGHADREATQDLYRALDAMIVALEEVKAREDAWHGLRALEARMRGLPDGFHFAQRDRRINAQGALRLVHLSERDRAALDPAGSSTMTTETEKGRSLVASYARSDSTVSIDSGSSRGSSGSGSSSSSSSSSVVGSLALTLGGSELSSAPSTPRSAPASPYTLNWSRPLPPLSSSCSSSPTDSEKVLSWTVAGPPRPARAAEKSVAPPRLRTRARESSVQAWVLSGVVVLAHAAYAPAPAANGGDGARLRKNVKKSEREKARDVKEPIRVLDGIGVARVVAVRDLSGRTEHDFLVHIDVLPLMGNNQPGSPTSTAPTSLFFTLPPPPRPTSPPSPLLGERGSSESPPVVFGSWLRAFTVAGACAPSIPPCTGPIGGKLWASQASTPARSGSPEALGGVSDEKAWWVRRLQAVRREMDGADPLGAQEPPHDAGTQRVEGIGLVLEPIVR